MPLHSRSWCGRERGRESDSKNKSEMHIFWNERPIIVAAAHGALGENTVPFLSGAKDLRRLSLLPPPLPPLPPQPQPPRLRRPRPVFFSARSASHTPCRARNGGGRPAGGAGAEPGQGGGRLVQQNKIIQANTRTRMRTNIPAPKLQPLRPSAQFLKQIGSDLPLSPQPPLRDSAPQAAMTIYSGLAPFFRTKTTFSNF